VRLVPIQRPCQRSRPVSLVNGVSNDSSLFEWQDPELTDPLGPRLGVLQVERVGRFESVVLFAARRDEDQR
jgi:hypothetical protein